MALYRRKPNVIEAVQFDPAQPLPTGVIARDNIIGGRGYGSFKCGVSYFCGDQRVTPGDWIDVTDPKQARVIPREEFEALYEPAGETIEERVQRAANSVFESRRCGGCPGPIHRATGLNAETGRVWARVSCGSCGGYQEAALPIEGVARAS